MYSKNCSQIRFTRSILIIDYSYFATLDEKGGMSIISLLKNGILKFSYLVAAMMIDCIGIFHSFLSLVSYRWYWKYLIGIIMRCWWMGFVFYKKKLITRFSLFKLNIIFIHGVSKMKQVFIFYCSRYLGNINWKCSIIKKGLIWWNISLFSVYQNIILLK